MARRASLWLLVALVATLGSAGAALAVTFEDAESTGIGFRHAVTDLPGSTINYPETTGSGVCWGDVDGDGTDDVFWVNGKYSNEGLQTTFDPRSALYLNDGDGTFTDASKAWGADLSAWGQGCSFADYDGDADLDLIVVGYDFIALLRNEAGRGFSKVTAQANLSLAGKCGSDPYCFGESAAWADYDRDGDLDVYVTNMVNWNIDDPGPVSPGIYDGQTNVMFKNRGDGTFYDATAESNTDDDPGPTHSKSFQSAWADYDRDGDPDLYIASDTTANTLFRNNGDGTFTDVAEACGVADTREGMGLVFQDVDNDALPDLYFTHYEGNNNGFYVNQGTCPFKDRSGEGELNADLLLVGWGTGFDDFDHDGDVDIYAVNGHTDPNLPGHKQKALLFLQNPDGTFKNVSEEAGGSFQNGSVARGSAVADYDLDGDLDIAVLASFNETARLFRNQGASGSWLQVEVRQPGSQNFFAVGAEVTITPQGGTPRTRVVQAGNSFLSMDSMVVHAGLGTAGLANVSVRWPDGLVETWGSVAPDQRVRLVRGSPGVIRDTLSPMTSVVLAGEGQNGWYRGDVLVTLDATDRAMGVASGVVLTELRVGSGTWQVYAGPFTVKDEGVLAVEARSRDAVGNQEPVRGQEVRIDRHAPVTTATVAGERGEDDWYRRHAAVLLDARDALSGVGEVKHRVDGGAWTEGEVVSLAEPGAHLVEFHALDVAGNSEAVKALVVKVDTAPPSVRVEPWPLAMGSQVTLEALASDATSGVRRVLFFLDGEPAPRFVDTEPGDGWRWGVEAPPGLHEVTAVAVDAAGFTAGAGTTVFLLPPLPPLPLPAGFVAAGALPWAFLRQRRR